MLLVLDFLFLGSKTQGRISIKSANVDYLQEIKKMYNKEEEQAGKKLSRNIHRVCSDVGDASEVKGVEEGKIQKQDVE